MAIAPDEDEIKTIEESMVHDQDEDPSKVKGWALYLTLRFISKVTFGVYGLMLLAMLVLQLALRGGEKMPASLSPESLLVALPFVLVAVFFYFDAGPEPELEKHRTAIGRGVTFVAVFVVVQVVSVLLWVILAKSFSLH